MRSRVAPQIKTLKELLAFDDAIDQAVCGVSLEAPESTRLAAKGAHDPTPTPYFVLDELFDYLSFNERSHLLDVGCSTGRVLAYFLRKGFPGRATGIELDPKLAAVAQTWTARHPNLEVIQGSVLDVDLSDYTDFYLFNPFDSPILSKFIRAIEAQVKHACCVIHMSDNGDYWWYQGRDGWTEVASGEFQFYKNERGFPVRVYDYPQHYTVWRFDPTLA